MDSWIDGLLDGLMAPCFYMAIDWWIDRSMVRCIHGLMAAWIDGLIAGWIDGLMDGWIDGWLD